jgi:hypothetical protein
MREVMLPSHHGEIQALIEDMCKRFSGNAHNIGCSWDLDDGQSPR